MGEAKQEQPVKKALKYKMLPEGLYLLYYEGGGELPAKLAGKYTSVFACQAAISAYQDRQ